MPRAIAGLIIVVIAAASLASLLWPSLPFNAPVAPVPGPSAVGVITKDIEVVESAGRISALAPDFQWVDPAGRVRTLSALRGHLVVINFWATWCVPLSGGDAGARARGGRPSRGHLPGDRPTGGRREVRGFFDSLGLRSLEPLLDTNASVARRYAVFSLPTTFFLDRDGRIALLEFAGR